MYVKVRATTDARRESLRVLAPDTLAIAVKEPAERNAANARIIALVAAHYSVSPKQVRIIKGHHSPAKVLAIIQ